MKKIVFGVFLAIFVIANAGSQEIKQSFQLELARSAAKAFCLKFEFPSEKIKQLNESPFNISSVNREEHKVISYRWLGGGRGNYYVQTEINKDNNEIVVYGGYSHKEFGPWIYNERKKRNPELLTKEFLINHEFALFSPVFSVQFKEGFPIKFLSNNQVITENLALVTKWRIGENNNLELLSKNKIVYNFMYDSQSAYLIAIQKHGGSQVKFEIKLKKDE